MHDPFAAALEQQHHADQRTIARLREEIKDEQSMTRGYRRLFIEALRKCGRCPLCNPPKEGT